MAPQAQDLARNLAVCHLTVQDYVRACFVEKKIPRVVWEIASRSQLSEDLVCIMWALGAFEPLCGTRPGLCAPATYVDQTVPVPPATFDAEGRIKPTTKLLLPFCAPMNRSVIIDTLRVTPANLTAAEAGETDYGKLSFAGFGELCLPFEPQDRPGRFDNVEHLVLCPQSGFSVFGVNNDPTSDALFHVEARLWSCC